jgi:hypothetical protein
VGLVYESKDIFYCATIVFPAIFLFSTSFGIFLFRFHQIRWKRKACQRDYHLKLVGTESPDPNLVSSHPLPPLPSLIMPRVRGEALRTASKRCRGIFSLSVPWDTTPTTTNESSLPSSTDLAVTPTAAPALAPQDDDMATPSPSAIAFESRPGTAESQESVNPRPRKVQILSRPEVRKFDVDTAPVMISSSNEPQLVTYGSFILCDLEDCFETQNIPLLIDHEDRVFVSSTIPSVKNARYEIRIQKHSISFVHEGKYHERAVGVMMGLMDRLTIDGVSFKPSTMVTVDKEGKIKKPNSLMKRAWCHRSTAIKSKYHEEASSIFDAYTKNQAVIHQLFTQRQERLLSNAFKALFSSIKGKRLTKAVSETDAAVDAIEPDNLETEDFEPNATNDVAEEELDFEPNAINDVKEELEAEEKDL